ncbi:RimK family alpha-L-glutamate ligase [Actinomadura parmotrematis]|uniref:RimK family alpha-L-glutamate ligase n=1 Tax=Actinomadura parmotrematis TaxID=2864039 RepID=A0ABS7G4V3_9ACTN|nr:RimK family alpha-L-glutamate ligase [Actinomadura parmotrematis]MBW8486822.1 RimK family alpha-L-glutamate ligase [Actinomadura parmotrematis]
MSGPVPGGPVVVLASRVRAEEKRIIAALRARGADCVHVDTRTLAGAPAASDRSLVLNREIGQARAAYAGSLLEARGAVVVNSAAATEVCGDKWRTALALGQAGLPVPRTHLALTPEAALAALDELGYPAVVKPLVGSWGRLVTRVADRAMAAAVLEHVAALPSPRAHIVLAQELVAGGRSVRVVVVGGEALGATWHRSEQWRANVARGASARALALRPDHAKLAARAADATGAEIAGVDLIEDAAGRTRVLEVNHGVEFTGFQDATGIDVAARIADHLIARTVRDA